MGRTQAEDSHHRASQFATVVASGPVGENSSCLSHLGDQDIQRTDSVWKPQSIQPLRDRDLLLPGARSKEPYIRLHETSPSVMRRIGFGMPTNLSVSAYLRIHLFRDWPGMFPSSPRFGS